jgi:hypothetical protein
MAETANGHRVIDPGALDEVRDGMYPMLPMPAEWRTLEDGAPAPNWSRQWLSRGRALNRLQRCRGRASLSVFLGICALHEGSGQSRGCAAA